MFSSDYTVYWGDNTFRGDGGMKSFRWYDLVVLAAALGIVTVVALASGCGKNEASGERVQEEPGWVVETTKEGGKTVMRFKPNAAMERESEAYFEEVIAEGERERKEIRKRVKEELESIRVTLKKWETEGAAPGTEAMMESLTRDLKKEESRLAKLLAEWEAEDTKQ